MNSQKMIDMKQVRVDTYEKKLPNYGIVIYKDALQQLSSALDNNIMENQYFNTQHVLYIA